MIGRAGISPPGGGFPPATGVVGYSNVGGGFTQGIGVFGHAASATGLTLGGDFFSAGNLGTGVKGTASSPTGITFGGKSDNESTDGVGVQGKTNALTGFTYGGRFECRSSTIGIGVLGYATSPTGVTYGVYGRTISNDPNAYGVWSQGRFGASGTKSFRIDHPLDPANKYLMHYCAEGPEPQNVYNGTVRTDADGYAWVRLPDYFQEINKDFRYQLTVVDDSDDFVLAKVTREIADNQFQIRTSRPQVKVCWEVKGVRNDLFVRTYGAPVEVEKGEAERGKYQHPELYGQAPEMGMNYRPDDERPESEHPSRPTAPHATPR